MGLFTGLLAGLFVFDCLLSDDKKETEKPKEEVTIVDVIDETKNTIETGLELVTTINNGIVSINDNMNIIMNTNINLPNDGKANKKVLNTINKIDQGACFIVEKLEGIVANVKDETIINKVNYVCNETLEVAHKINTVIKNTANIIDNGCAMYKAAKDCGFINLFMKGLRFLATTAVKLLVPSAAPCIETIQKLLK